MLRRFIVVLSFVGLALPVSAYEAFFTYPGTRAMGMAGNFLAVANDSSAMWYNPAGLAQPDAPTFDVGVEYGAIPVVDNGALDSTEAALKFASLNTHLGNFAFGLSYMLPYKTEILQLETEHRQVSAGLAYRFDFGLGFGATFDYPIYKFESATLDEGELSGEPGFSAGVLWTLVDGGWGALRAGGLYRSEIKVTSDKYSNIEDVAPGRAQTIGGGASFDVFVGPVLCTLAGQYEQIAWGEWQGSSDVTRMGGGLEVMLPLGSTSLSFRGGYATMAYDASDSDIHSYTGGLGFAVGPLVLDGAYEYRGDDAESISLWSASVALQF